MISVPRNDGPQRFVGERMLVVPRGRARSFLQLPTSPGIVVTDCGYFPRAAHHHRARMDPIAEAIVIACVEGRGWCDTGFGRVLVGPGQILLMPPGQVHAYGADDDDPWTVWWVHIAGPTLPAFLEAHGVTGTNPVQEPAAFFEITTLLSTIVATLEPDLTAANLTRAAGTAWQLVCTIVSDRPASPGVGSAVEAAAAVIRRDLTTKAASARFAAGAHVSVSHFSTQFRRRFGMSVQTYQLHARMARARELFDIRALSVTEVAKTVGYTDPLYFTRQFTRLHGVSPSVYRSGDRGEAVVADSAPLSRA